MVCAANGDLGYGCAEGKHSDWMMKMKMKIVNGVGKFCGWELGRRNARMWIN